LYITPEYNKEYPFIVYHPFISQNPVPILDENGKLKVIDIFKDELGFQEIIDKIKNDILKAKCFADILYHINKPYRLLYLYSNQNNMNLNKFTEYLRDVWIDTEFPNADKNVSVSEVLKLFEKSDKSKLMDEEELEIYNKLPDVVTIYRGTYDSTKTKALSWTLDYDVAHWFATRFDDNGYVLQAKINKKDIFAFFDSRGEKEVIINYKKFKNLTFNKVMKIKI